MWRKASRLAGGRLPRSEERGAWAELYFMMLAAGLGMKVSRPFSNVGRYDVGVENQDRVLRVQVKSTIFKQHESKTSRLPKECYSLNVTGPQRQKYAPGTVDFFAILLIPIDEWYIIPFDVIGTTVDSIHFTPKSKRQKYGEYREAWHLLRETGLTIQACVDPDWAEVGAGSVVADADSGFLDSAGSPAPRVILLRSE
jgi:PD-(D/E)XK endonuclease